VSRPKVGLEGLTKAQLYERAQAEDVPGRSEMTKDELINALRSKRRHA
jgi:DNA end-binding protein Ku